MADIQSLSKDPDFMRLSPEAQGHVLRTVDPEFAGLSEGAQGHVIRRMATQFAPPAGSKPAPPPALQGEPAGYWSQVGQNLPMSAIDLPGKMAHMTPGMPQSGTLPVDPRTGNAIYAPNPIRDITEGAKSFLGALSDLPGTFAQDPAGTAAMAAAAGRAGVKSIPEGTGAAIKAAAPDVATGAAKVGGGVALGHVLPGELHYAAAYPIYRGMRQMGQGLKAGKEAFLAARAPEIPAPPAEALSHVPELPSLYDDIAMGQAGKKYARLDPAGQETVRTIADRLSAPAPIPPPPMSAPPNVETPNPESATGFKHTARHTDLLRQLHTQGKELDLGPESPAGQTMHLTPTAQSIYGVKGSELTTPQLESIVEFVNTRKRLPTPGDILTGVFKKVK